jgi:hypothetical protein
MDPTDLIPERRAKSWKREHEERCRRHQNNNDLKKCRDPGYGSDETVLLDIKDSTTHFVKDEVGVEKVETPASIDADENALMTTTGDSVIEYESTNKAPVEGDVINNLVTTDRRDKGVLPCVQTIDLKIEKNLLFKQGREKDREDFAEINGLGLDMDRDAIKPGHVCGDVSVCVNVVEGEEEIILQQCETGSVGNTAERYSVIPVENEIECSKLDEVRSDVLEVPAESSGLTEVKGTESLQLEEALTVAVETISTSYEIPQRMQSGFSGISEGDQTMPVRVEPDSLGSAVPSFLDVLEDAASGGLPQGLLECSDVSQGLSGNLRTVPECNMNNNESAQEPEVLFDTGDNLGNAGKGSELPTSDALKLEISDLSQVTLSDIRDVQTVNLLDSSHITSSVSDLGNRKGTPDENGKGSVKSDDQKDSFITGDSILSSPEAPGKVTEQLNKKESVNDKQGQNLFVELTVDENLRPAECVDEMEHPVCVVDSARSLSPFEEGKQYSCEFLESLDRSGQINKHLTDSSFGNVGEYKTINSNYKNTEEDDTGMNKVESSAVELSQENSKHLVDESSVEMVGDTFNKYVQLESTSATSAGSEYCHGVDPVLDQTLPSEPTFLQPPAMADEDKVNFFVLILL